jgi:putative radical SAM enzyme (TIGR03279 family)
MPKRVPETGVRVLAVDPKGLAARAGLRAGDRLLRVNGQALRDLVDFHVQAGEEQLAIDADRGGRPCSVVVERKWGRDLGLECEPPAPAEISTCANKCVFCFIHQLPPGLRKSLYVKDDDYRLSFLHGNYITLTDLPDSEVQRIVDLRLSPLYISVHATDPVLRHFLLGSPKTIKGDLMERLRRLADAGIRLHTQIVLCPGLNDGAHLERTVRELGELHPGVATVAVVPVGLTRHRDGLYPLRAITPAEAEATLDAIHQWQAGFLARHGARLVFAADELYLQAGRPIPPAAAYEGFSVVEDGVGLVRRFEDDLRRLAPRPGRPRWRGERVVTLVTGALFGPILSRLVETVRLPGLRAVVVAVPNDFFGRAITVAGLLTGQDVARALSGRPLGDAVLIPRVALTETKGVFLDDAAPEDLQRHLGAPIVSVEASARGLVDGLLGRMPTPA